MLNDHFGIQTRGGCSCAGTYGHYLLSLDHQRSDQIYEEIMQGNCSSKPGWIRLSIHPTHTDDEIDHIIKAIRGLVDHHKEWMKDYELDLAASKISCKDPKADNAVFQHIDDIFS